jgi:type III restriction enzyme
MELKRYQKQVLHDVERFIGECNNKKEIRNAYKRYWELKAGITPGEGSDIPPYRTTVARVPRVTVKVPTAGGKTFIACNALSRIFSSLGVEGRRMVLWFVPNDAILEQTLHNLRDPRHPYRICLDTHFGGRVRVYDKEELLQGTDFTPQTVADQLSVAVLSISSFASSSKDFLRVKRENGRLMSFEQMVRRNVCKLPGIEPSALIQVLNALNPVIVNDESHNFRSDLRLEVLKQLNPSFILELTATPREGSNIISFVDAKQLKDEHMVKLPVIVYNNSTKTDVLLNSIQLRNKLEQQAQAAEAKGGRYIRPIVLFQAEPRTAYDSETFDKIKSELTEVGIPEEQIKIKTAGRNELKGIDLTSRDCPVRYIITVNALKEGWDCPFAYILASLANRSSKIDVEQILGRILRLPYATESNVEFLNMGYVFTSSNDFQRTIEGIIEGLHNSGYSARDYRAAEVEESYTEARPVQLGLFDSFAGDTPAGEGTDAEDETATDVDADSVNTHAIREALMWDEENDETSEAMNQVLNTAIQQSLDFGRMMADETADDNGTDDPTARLPRGASKDRVTEMRSQLKSRGEAVRLPQFVLQRKNINSIFSDSNEPYVSLKLERENLCEGFDLDRCDRDVELSTAGIEVTQIDITEAEADEFVPKAWNLDERQMNEFKEYIKTLATDVKIKKLANRISRSINHDAIKQESLEKYVADILEAVSTLQLEQLTDNIGQAICIFKSKIDSLLTTYATRRFDELQAAGEISVAADYALRKNMTIVCRSGRRIAKSLYKDEEAFTAAEAEVIAAVAALPEVDFWHRNQEHGRGFSVNGVTPHNPDFIVRTKGGLNVLIEVRSTADAAERCASGKALERMAGADKLRYYLVDPAISAADGDCISLKQLTEEMGKL